MGNDPLSPKPLANTCLALALFLLPAGCAPSVSDTTSGQASGETDAAKKSDGRWPGMLDAAPQRADEHVWWLNFGEAVPVPVAIHPEGHLVALKTSCESVVYDLRSGKRLHSWLLPTTVLQFSRDGSRVLTKRKRDFAIWDAARFVETSRFAGDRLSWSERVEVDDLGRRPSGPLVAALSDYSNLVAISNHHASFDGDRPAALLLYTDDGASGP